MKSFTAWPERKIVQRVVAQLPWRQNIALLERLDDEKTRLWYARQTLPPVDPDMAARGRKRGLSQRTGHKTPADSARLDP